MKALFFLVLFSTALPACMTQQDRLNWDQTVSWYKGHEPEATATQAPAAPAADSVEQTVEAKVGPEKEEVESPAEAEAK